MCELSGRKFFHPHSNELRFPPFRPHFLSIRRLRRPLFERGRKPWLFPLVTSSLLFLILLGRRTAIICISSCMPKSARSPRARFSSFYLQATSWLFPYPLYDLPFKPRSSCRLSIFCPRRPPHSLERAGSVPFGKRLFSKGLGLAHRHACACFFKLRPPFFRSP